MDDKSRMWLFHTYIPFLGGRGVGGMAGSAMIKSNADNWKRLAVTGGWGWVSYKWVLPGIL